MKARVGIIGEAGEMLDRALAADLEPVVSAKDSPAPRPGVVVVDDYAALTGSLAEPRAYLLDAPAGAAIDRTLDEASRHMDLGDVVIDFSGSYWGDTLRRWRRMRHRSLFYVDGAAAGDALLVSGDPAGIDVAMLTVQALAGTAPVVRAGPSGASHFALMVHDGWLTAAAEAASEARHLLEAFPGDIAADVLDAALGGAVARPSGRAAWLLDDAVRLEAATPMLAQAVMLALAGALDELRSSPPPIRVGGFVRPEEVA